MKQGGVATRNWRTAGVHCCCVKITTESVWLKCKHIHRLLFVSDIAAAQWVLALVLNCTCCDHRCHKINLNFNHHTCPVKITDLSHSLFLDCFTWQMWKLFYCNKLQDNNASTDYLPLQCGVSELLVWLLWLKCQKWHRQKNELLSILCSSKQKDIHGNLLLYTFYTYATWGMFVLH